MLILNVSKFLALFILLAVFQQPASATKKVYLGGHSHGPQVTSDQLNQVADSHHEFLGTILGSKEKAKDAIFYSYENHINGFSAMLDEDEVAGISNHPSVVSVFPNHGINLHTTHSWNFLMLERNGVIHRSSLWRKARFGENTIIANLDTGVWPESESFNDSDYGPIPSRWKGTCDNADSFTCNRKLIGARFFNKGYVAHEGDASAIVNTARDYQGHGSHTLTTAGGNFVQGASVFGMGNGTAKGGSPRARVATYKVCYPTINNSKCFDSDILKAFDTAISDGVDVISLSLGGAPFDYFKDGIAIGAFHAVRNGVVVVASAGNSGPKLGTVSNVAPWLLTVGASTLDRNFVADVKLGNGLYLKGTSLSKPLPKDTFYPLISAANANADGILPKDSILCKPGTLDPMKVMGKILVCLLGDNLISMQKGEIALLAGAVGMILCNDEIMGNKLFGDPHVLPATQINYTDGVTLFKYVNSAKNPIGYIVPPHTEVNIKPAPFMAFFSSRGPNTINPEILKPDIIAPGVSIIAAYSQGISPSHLAFDKRRTPFIVETGTSMSCPHVSGIVGLLKTLYPNWSPAAIKSAIMTTARRRDNTGNPMVDWDYSKATPLAYGAGHVRPNRAMNPGLVYDLSVDDYLDFLCGLGYSQTMLSSFTGSNMAYDCPKNYSILNFNYPSITVPNVSQPVTVHRRLKNVGTPGVYVARLSQPVGFEVSVEPKILKFNEVGEEKRFKLKIKAQKGSRDGEYVFGELLWSDGKHYVRSPIVVPSVGQASEIPDLYRSYCIFISSLFVVLIL